MTGLFNELSESAHIKETSQDSGGQLTLFRSQGFSLSIPQMLSGMDDYFSKRLAFRKRIMDELKEGIHYGYPPGVSRSNAPENQWVSSPSLYKRGAAEICSLFKLRAEFHADRELWEQLGSNKGTIAIKCRLFNAGGELVGEGFGSRKVGDKKMAENASVKMAEKSALVDAVLNGFGLSDLFTQDLEDLGRETYEVPESRENPPVAIPRSARVESKELSDLIFQFRAIFIGKSKEDWVEYVNAATAASLTIETVTKPSCWTIDMVSHVRDALQREAK